MKKLPIGIQDYKDLITNDFVYVDKTKYIYDLISSGKVYFLSRPRRFGKSLTTSTLYYLFKGERELFKDTYIYDKFDFKRYPVIKISMSEVDAESKDVLNRSLLFRLKTIGKGYGIDIGIDSVKLAFLFLIEELSKNDKVAVIIDEYDKPILDNINNKEKVEEIRDALRNFYIVLKDTDPYLKFVFITGISKFSKVGVFSGLNNLNDITLNRRYATFLGYTEEEIKLYFRDHIEEMRKELGITEQEFWRKVREWYNGYSWDGRSFVYNPFSILCMFSNMAFRNYWFETGSPSFLIDYIKKHEIQQLMTEDLEFDVDYFSDYEIEIAPPASFLWQAGYLTIVGTDGKFYRLDFPNLEVKKSFGRLLLVNQYYMADNQIPKLYRTIHKGFKNRNFGIVFDEINRILSSIPYNIASKLKSEEHYQALMLSIFWASEIPNIPEEMSYRGRADITLIYDDSVWIIELKKTTVEEALKQIKERGYHKKYLDGYREIYLVGIKIDIEGRNLEEFRIEKAG